MPDITLDPITQAIDAQLSPPGSKSLTNRALVLAALASGKSRLNNVLLADDTHVMLESLQRLGFALSVDEQAHTVDIDGHGGDVPATSAELFCGNSGTTIRFLTALCALGRGNYTLDGVPRMRQRPIGELVTLLHNLGVRIDYLDQPGFVPIRVNADRLPGGMVRFGAAQSSQYLSALLMAAPYAKHEVLIDLDPGQTSWPYVTMTMRLMDEFGVMCHLVRDARTSEPKQLIIPRGVYVSGKHNIEPDASNATYFLAVGAIHPGSRVRVDGLGRSSLQGDVGFADLLEQMGAKVSFERDSITVEGPKRLHGIDADLSAMPDTAQTLAVVAMFAEERSTLRGLKTLRVKETDRLAALSNELTRLGAQVEIIDDALDITPPQVVKPARIETYEDHRMAMSFAVAATRVAGVVIGDAECVNKTYPGFFHDLKRTMGT